MAGTNLSFSKVVATPTPNAWSQAYSAGSLFAAISLQTETISPEVESLNKLGKDLISTLESEFFPLENKDLESIKQAIISTTAKVNEEVKLSFVVCYLNDNILYLYATGGGKAILKREDKIGTVIDSDEGNEVKSASGYVQDKDSIVLQTQPFIRIVSSSTLASALDRNNPDEVAEDLAPHVHEKTEGGASAVILTYKEESSGVENVAASASATAVDEGEIPEKSEEVDKTSEDLESLEETLGEESDINESTEEISGTTPSTTPMNQNVENTPPTPLPSEKNENQASPFLTNQKSRRKMPSIGLGRLKRMGRRRLILLVGIILIVLVLIIVAYIFLGRGSGSNSQFDEIYNEARAKFEEGQSLKDLNSELAQENFKEAQAILVENKDTFSQGSDEDNQIEALLVQVNNELNTTTEDSSSSATEVDKSESQFLSVQIDNPDSVYFTQNEDFIYFINENGVTRLDKGNSQDEEIIDKSWEEAGGIGVFGSNVYVLDKTDNILKFVPTGDEFASSDYITGEADLANSVAMAIDGSVYVLNEDGTITKFTRGAEEEFSVTGLEKSMSGPTRIITSEDFDNIYILDKGNSRIVVLSKEGDFIKAYSADILKNARDIDPQEGDGAIFILSGDKVYKIDIQ